MSRGSDHYLAPELGEDGELIDDRSDMFAPA